jgi:serine phosphatase RsbU (regulator of sigma subunit)
LAQRTQLESDKLRAEDAKLKAENKTQAVENQKQKEERDFQQKINYLISISLLIVVIFAFFVFQSRKKMSKAFRNLEEANTLVQQKKEEIEIQTEELQQTNDTLQKTLQFVNYQNKEINSSVKYALQIQTAMLPILADFEQVFPESFILFKPRDIVSGDFYWFAEVKKQGKSYTIVAVADCTGHGVPGAFLFMIGCNILNNLVKENRVTEPERILTLLDKELRKTLQQDSNKSKDGMDMQIVTITKNIEQQDIEASFDKIEYAGAMNPLYYVENQVFHEIKATKLPIGGGTDTNKVFDKHIIVLQKNTDGAKNNTSFIMYLTTDGFQDQFGGKESRKFMTRRFRELLLNISPKPMSEQKEILEKTITEWIVFGREQQTDDITIMGICLYS